MLMVCAPFAKETVWLQDQFHPFLSDKMSRKLQLFCGFVVILSGVVLGIALVVNLPVWARTLAKIGVGIGLVGAVILTIVRTLYNEKLADALALNLVLLSGTLMVLLPISEIITRFYFQDITSTPNIKTYFGKRWWQNNVRQNSLGFREREFQLEKPAGIYRIAIIGDSFSYGQGIPERERLSNLIEETMRKEGHSIEVLNFARSGTATVNHVDILQNDVLKTTPDFVLLQWLPNDMEDYEFRKQTPRAAPLLPSEVLHPIFMKSSALYYIAQENWLRIQERLGLVKSYDTLLSQLLDTQNYWFQRAMDALKRFIRICQQKNIPMAIILFPMLHNDLGTGYVFASFHEKVIEQCAASGIRCVDLRSVFAPYLNRQTPHGLWVNRLDPHPNGLANRLAMDKILKELGPEWKKPQTSVSGQPDE